MTAPGEVRRDVSAGTGRVLAGGLLALVGAAGQTVGLWATVLGSLPVEALPAVLDAALATVALGLLVTASGALRGRT